MSQIIDELDFEWIMIDGSHTNIHPHAAGADMSRAKGLNTKIYLAVDARGAPIRFIERYQS